MNPTNELLVEATTKAVTKYLSDLGKLSVEEQIRALNALSNRIAYQAMVLSRSH